MNCFCCLDELDSLIECPNCSKRCCINCLSESNSFTHCINCKVGKFNIINMFNSLPKKQFRIFISKWLIERKKQYEELLQPIKVQAHDYVELIFEIPEDIIIESLQLYDFINEYWRCLKSSTDFISSCCIYSHELNSVFQLPHGYYHLKQIIKDIKSDNWFVASDLRFYLSQYDNNDAELILELKETLDNSKYNFLKIMTKSIIYEILTLRQRYNKVDTEKHLVEYMLRNIDLKNSISDSDILPVINCCRCKGVVIKQGNEYKCNLCKTIYCPECMQPKLKDHKHESEDCEKWLLLQGTTKPCPKCGFRFEKLDGCDDMFCTNCHTGFLWSTSEIKLGSFHNPERQEWLSKIKDHSNNIASTLREYDLETRLDISRQILDRYHDCDSVCVKTLINKYESILKNKYTTSNIEILIVNDLILEEMIQTIMSILVLYENDKSNKYTIYKYMFVLYSKIDTFKRIFNTYNDLYKYISDLLVLC